MYNHKGAVLRLHIQLELVSVLASEYVTLVTSKCLLITFLLFQLLLK